MEAAAKDRQVPLGLIVAGLAMFAAAVLLRGGGAAGTGVVLGLAAAATVVGVLLMLLAALITSKVTGANFGELGPAALKLTAIYLAANGVGALVGGAIGSLIAAAAFFSLIIWLFELEMPYAVAFTVINWGIQFVAGLMIAGATARRY